MSGSALLVAAIDVPLEIEEDFTAWYDGEHVPERLAVPGIEHITRWERIAGQAPRFLALFEAGGLDVFSSGPYSQLKAQGDTPWTARIRPRFERTLRGIFAEAATFGHGEDETVACAAAFTSVPAVDEPAYRAWYAEHGAAIAGVPGVARVRRLEQEGEPRHLTIVELSDVAALDTDAYAAAKAATPDPALRARWQREQGLYRLLRAWGP